MSCYNFPLTRDPLEVLSGCRRRLIANKTRDFAAELEAAKPWLTWPPVTHNEARSLATGEPVETLSREDFNARRRAWEESHELRPRYNTARLRAGRRVSGLAQADMLAMATRCVTRTNELRAAMGIAA